MSLTARRDGQPARVIHLFDAAHIQDPRGEIVTATTFGATNRSVTDERRAVVDFCEFLAIFAFGSVKDVVGGGGDGGWSFFELYEACFGGRARPRTAYQLQIELGVNGKPVMPYYPTMVASVGRGQATSQEILDLFKKLSLNV